MHPNRIEIKKRKIELVLISALITIIVVAAIVSLVLTFVSYPKTPNEKFFIRRLNVLLSNEEIPRNFQNKNYVFPDEYGYLEDSATNNFPYITVENLETKISEEDKNIIEYECDIPSPAYTALNLTVYGYFEDTHGVLDSVHIKGTAKIKRTFLGKKIIVDEDNTLFYMLFNFKNATIGLLSDDIDTALEENYIFVTSEYLKFLEFNEEEKSNFMTRTVSDLNYLMIIIESRDLDHIVRSSYESNRYAEKLKVKIDYSQYKTYYICIGATVVSLVLCFLSRKMWLFFNKRLEKSKMKELQRLKEELKDRIYSGTVQLNKYQKIWKDNIFIDDLNSLSSCNERILHTIIGIVFNPTSNTTIISLLRQIVADNYGYKNKADILSQHDDYIEDRDLFEENENAQYVSETILGWSMCALARCVTLNAGNKIHLKKSQFNNTLKAFNTLLEKGKELHKEYEEIIHKYYPYGRLAEDTILSPWLASEIEINKKLKEINAHNKKMYGGAVGYCMSKKTDLSIETFIYIINSHKQHQSSDFMLQNLVIGLFPYINKHKDSPQIKDWYTTLLSIQNNLTDLSNIGFFEVRLSKRCDPKTFSNILQEILSCISLSFDYADMNKMVDILTAEIPNVMGLLRRHPIRLISTNNKDVKGFLKMDSFNHILVTNYSGKIGEGPVNKRYNKIIDRTLPNSSGINLELLCDCYSAVPVLFHEFLHYLGHQNEAAVFLATYNFCKYYYDKYSDATKTLFYDHNYTYVALKNGLKGKDKQEQIEFINKMIFKMYGRKMNIEDAKVNAATKIIISNYNLTDINNKQIWHREVPYPPLTKHQDPVNSRIAYNAEIRLLTADKELDDKLYDKYQNEWKTMAKDRLEIKKRHKVHDDLDIYIEKALKRQIESAKIKHKI